VEKVQKVQLGSAKQLRMQSLGSAKAEKMKAKIAMAKAQQEETRSRYRK
jgi:hypothetical protein